MQRYVHKLMYTTLRDERMTRGLLWESNVKWSVCPKTHPKSPASWPAARPTAPPRALETLASTFAAAFLLLSLQCPLLPQPYQPAHCGGHEDDAAVQWRTGTCLLVTLSERCTRLNCPAQISLMRLHALSNFAAWQPAAATMSFEETEILFCRAVM